MTDEDAIALVEAVAGGLLIGHTQAAPEISGVAKLLKVWEEQLRGALPELQALRGQKERAEAERDEARKTMAAALNECAALRERLATVEGALSDAEYNHGDACSTCLGEAAASQEIAARTEAENERLRERLREVEAALNAARTDVAVVARSGFDSTRLADARAAIERIDVVLDGAAHSPAEKLQELAAAGDLMQSSLSRLAEHIIDIAQPGTVPYETRMAALEGQSAVHEWTELRALARGAGGDTG